MNLLLYIVACLIQPICLPVPELSTVLTGTLLFGPHIAFAVALICIMLGITFMYYITQFLSKKYLKNLMKSESFKSYRKYVSKNPFLTTGILFAIPVIPDEIICIGSSLGGIKFKMLFPIALFAKIFSIGIVTYSEPVANFLDISHFWIVMLEIGIMLIASGIYKLVREK